jgi:hypothetical protein
MSSEEKKPSIMELARKRFAKVVEVQGSPRDEANIDLRMIVGGKENHWEPAALAARNGRPTLCINKLPKFLRSVTGDQRKSRPSVKVRPVDSKADPQIANILEGHIRNIEYTSNASYSYDSAFKHATSCGFPGYWRLLTDYSDDDVFEQDIKIAPVRNHFSVYMDHSCVPYQGLEKYCFVVETMPMEEFKHAYPKADALQFTDGATGDEMSQWFDDDGIRVAEYFYKVAATKTILQLRTGEVVELTAKMKPFLSPDRKMLMSAQGEPMEVVKERTVESHKIMWAKICGLDEPLEGPQEWAGKYIPVIPVMPEEFIIDGKPVWKGMVRDARDPTMLYNYVASANIEAVALSPKSPLMIGKSQLDGNEAQWNNAHTTPYPYLVYNDEAGNTSIPQRTAPVQQQPGLLATMQQANMDFEDTIGIFRAGLGAPSNEKSGIAIRERKESSDVGTYEYHDNLSRAIQWSYRVLIDLIPRIYDTERGLRLMNPDDTESHTEINKEIIGPDGTKTIINDITQGKYDVVATLGPAYATQRQEGQQVLSDILTAIAPVAPQTVPVILPRLFKLMDFPEAQEITKELRAVFGQDEEGKQQEKGPDPMQEMQQQMAQVMMQLEVREKEANIAKIETASMLDLAKAEAAEVGQDLAEYKMIVEDFMRMNQPQPMEQQPQPQEQAALPQGA